MPRVHLLRKNYIEKDLARIIRGVMAESRTRQSEVAAELGISQQAVSQKLKSGSMTAKDLILILRLCEADRATIERILKL